MHNGVGSSSRGKKNWKGKKNRHSQNKENKWERKRTCATSKIASKSQAGPQGTATANTLYITDKILPPGGQGQCDCYKALSSHIFEKCEKMSEWIKKIKIFKMCFFHVHVNVSWV